MVLRTILAILLIGSLAQASNFIDADVDKATFGVFTQDKKPKGTAHLIKYNKKSYVISAAHVCREMADGVDDVVYLQDARFKFYKSKVIALRFSHNICIIKAPKGFRGGLEGSSRPIKNGERARYIGLTMLDQGVFDRWFRSGFKSFNSVAKGITLDFYELLAVPGNSGSAIIDINGKVIGLLIMSAPELSMAAAVPYSEVIDLIKDLEE